ncbi:hypothetical protein [Amycolatopsis anabasis]|uniref:hypothetical protein n=1 Tax=Amycolatopsis anabasis TaxID=1840409 RepID=UPI00131BEF17|nr:hypothetical protein [Amycolatopsis anabasis]
MIIVLLMCALAAGLVGCLLWLARAMVLEMVQALRHATQMERLLAQRSSEVAQSLFVRGHVAEAARFADLASAFEDGVEDGIAHARRWERRANPWRRR